MKIPKNKRATEGGPFVLIYEDSGSLTGYINPIRVALYFETEEAAKAYIKKIIFGKDAKVDIYPLRTI